ncbi:hypothetical protein WJ967_04780 [Achromobacter xylosoxidans]
MKTKVFHWSSEVIIPTSGDSSWKDGNCSRSASRAISSARIAGACASRRAIQGNWRFWKIGWSPTREARAMRWRSQSMKRKKTRE